MARLYDRLFLKALKGLKTTGFRHGRLGFQQDCRCYSGNRSRHARADETVECDLGNCEAPAPYKLKIITRGEGAPQASNKTPEGLQQNRRVDVGISTKVPVPEVPVTTTATTTTTIISA